MSEEIMAEAIELFRSGDLKGAVENLESKLQLEIQYYLPFMILGFLCYYKSKLMDKDFSQKFGIMYENIRVDRLSPLTTIFVPFILRKFFS